MLQNELRYSDEELDRQESEFRKLVAQYSLKDELPEAEGSVIQ